MNLNGLGDYSRRICVIEHDLSGIAVACVFAVHWRGNHAALRNNIKRIIPLERQRYGRRHVGTNQYKIRIVVIRQANRQGHWIRLPPQLNRRTDFFDFCWEYFSRKRFKRARKSILIKVFFSNQNGFRNAEGNFNLLRVWQFNNCLTGNNDLVIFNKLLNDNAVKWRFQDGVFQGVFRRFKTCFNSIDFRFSRFNFFRSGAGSRLFKLIIQRFSGGFRFVVIHFGFIVHSLWSRLRLKQICHSLKLNFRGFLCSLCRFQLRFQRCNVFRSRPGF